MGAGGTNGDNIRPPKDKRESGNNSDEEEEEQQMDTSKPENTRKRKKDTSKTVNKKIKDNFDDENDLDNTGDIKPILSIGLTPPSNEVVEIENEC